VRVRSAVAFLVAAAACSAASTATVANFAGTYDMWVVNGANPCNFVEWTEGQSASGVPLVVTQDPITPTTMSATLGGAPGTLLLEEIAANDDAGTVLLTGTVGGNQATLTGNGSASQKNGSCTYTTTASLSVNFQGDTVQGTLTYEIVPVGNADCTAIAGCQTTQAFAGTIEMEGGTDAPSDGKSGG
jgi:hypothetical protein